MNKISKIFALLLMQTAVLTSASANTTKVESAPMATHSVFSLSDSDEKVDTLGRTVLLQEFSITKVIETDEAGNQILNEDGTVKYFYHIVDQNGTIWNASTVQTIYSIRAKAYKKIMLKVMLGGGIGALKDGKLDSILTGALAGVITSVDDIATIIKQNKDLKKFRKALDAYKKTFTDEGLPIDPSADLSNVEGLDITQAGEITKSAAEVKAELTASAESAPSLESLDF